MSFALLPQSTHGTAPVHLVHVRSAFSEKQSSTIGEELHREQKCAWHFSGTTINL